MTQDCSPEVLRRLLDAARAELAQKDDELARLREALAGKNAGAIVIVTPDELAQKDATIKALAEALATTARKRELLCWCRPADLRNYQGHSKVCFERRAALRMAGVLK